MIIKIIFYNFVHHIESIFGSFIFYLRFKLSIIKLLHRSNFIKIAQTLQKKMIPNLLKYILLL